jgi:hypothetical protein
MEHDRAADRVLLGCIRSGWSRGGGRRVVKSFGGGSLGHSPAFLVRADGTTSLVRRPRKRSRARGIAASRAGTGERGDVVDDMTEANGTVYLLPCSRPIRPLGAGT